MATLHVEDLAAFAARQPGTVLLDVREPWEVQLAALTLPGLQVLHIPMQQIPARLDEIGQPPSVVCICHHGVRSAQVVAFLLREGRSGVYNLAGGIDAWSARVDPGVPRY